MPGSGAKRCSDPVMCVGSKERLLDLETHGQSTEASLLLDVVSTAVSWQARCKKDVEISTRTSVSAHSLVDDSHSLL